MHFSKHLFSSWTSTKQTIGSKTQQKNKHEIPANLTPNIRYLLEMIENNKNDVKKHALFQTPFFLLGAYQTNHRIENATK